MEYWITIRFATGSEQEFHVTGIQNALRRASEIIEACHDVVVMELKIKVIQ